MSDFVFLYRGRDNQASPGHFERWRTWLTRLSESGHLKDFGQSLADSGKVVSCRQKTVADGPFAEAKDVVCGFTVIQARDLDQATELANSCPILEVNGSIEVRPIQPPHA